MHYYLFFELKPLNLNNYGVDIGQLHYHLLYRKLYYIKCIYMLNIHFANMDRTDEKYYV